MSAIMVAIALVFHLFPFRTEKLSPTAPMVLRKRESRSPPSFPKVRVPSPVIRGRDAFLACSGRGGGFPIALYSSLWLSMDGPMVGHGELVAVDGGLSCHACCL